MTFRKVLLEERASRRWGEKEALNHLYNIDQKWQLCIAFDYTRPGPTGRWIEIGEYRSSASILQ